MHEVSRLAATFLANSAWQPVLIAIVAGGCAWIAKRVSARCQHSVWVATLVLSVAVPVFGLVRTYAFPNLPTEVTPSSAGARTDLTASTQVQVTPSSNAQNRANAISPLWSEILRPQEHRIPLGTGLTIAVAAFYLLFLFSRVIRFWNAWKHAWQIAGSSTSSVPSPLLESAAERCRAAFELSDIPILCSSTIDAPATLGIRQPVVILPAALMEATDSAMLTSVIGHEMAHIKRRDFAFNLIYELLYLPISFHPVAALVKRRIAQTRELACDELVTERLLGPSEYARALVTVASRVTGIGRHSYTLGVFDADNLEERVMKLTDGKSRTSARVGAAILISAAVILVAAGAVASAYSLNAGPVSDDPVVGQQEQAVYEKAEKEKRFNQVVTKDGTVYAFETEIPADLKPLIGTWKGSHDFTPSESEVSRRSPVRTPDIRLVHSDVQITFGFEEGHLTATYMMYQKIIRTSGEETFQMNRFELVNPQFDGQTVTTATEGQQKENEMDEARSGQPGKRYFKIMLTGDGQAEAWNGAGEEVAPHIVLKREVPRDEPRGGSRGERRR